MHGVHCIYLNRMIKDGSLTNVGLDGQATLKAAVSTIGHRFTEYS